MTRPILVVAAALLLLACPSTTPSEAGGGGGGGVGGGGGISTGGACAGLGVGASCGTNAVCNAAGVCVGCEEGAACTPTDECQVGSIRCATGAPVCTAQGLAPVGTACATGVCSAAGACVPCVDGMACDLGEGCSVGAIACTNGAPSCTRARFKDPGAICRAATSACDVPERCSGTTPDCPVDEAAPDRTPCDDGTFCNGPDSCQAGQCTTHAGTPCAAPGLCNEVTDACVACLSNADCQARVPQTGCFVASCQPDGQCSTLVRHDDAAWKVDPLSSPEVQLGQNVTPTEAVFDGQDFLVMMTAAGQLPLARRVSQDGGVLDPAPFGLPANTQDLAFAGDRYLAVTIEPADATHAYDYVGGYYLDRLGRPTSAKFPVLVDVGSNCGGQPAHLLGPRVAANGSQFMVVAQVSCGYLARGVVLGGATWVSGTSNLRRPRYPAVFGRDGGFGVVTEDSAIGGGSTEVWGAQVSTSSSTPAIAGLVLDPYVPPGASGCCTSNHALAWGNSTWLLAWERGSGNLQLLSNTLQPVGSPTPVAGAWNYPNFSEAELGFDGSNFLVLASASGAGFRAMRVTETGQVLDNPQLVLPATDAGTLGTPQLASTRTGRWLIAYRKADGHTYARTFSTCP